MIDLTPILEALIALASALVTAFLVPYIKEKLTQTRLNELKVWVKAAVEAAEKIFNDTGLGEQKKAYVLGFLQNQGYSVDFEVLDTLIEAAVFEITAGEAIHGD